MRGSLKPGFVNEIVAVQVHAAGGRQRVGPFESDPVADGCAG
jgi:hypothetical protein